MTPKTLGPCVKHSRYTNHAVLVAYENVIETCVSHNSPFTISAALTESQAMGFPLLTYRLMGTPINYRKAWATVDEVKTACGRV